MPLVQKNPVVSAMRRTPSAVSVPLGAVLLSMVLLWATYFVLITLRSYVAGFEMQFDLASRRLIVITSGLALTVVLWLLLRLFDTRALWEKTFAAIILALPVALAIGQVNQLAFADLRIEEVKRYAEKNNLSLREDELGNLLGDVASQGSGDTANQGADEVASESILIAPVLTREDRWRSVIDIALSYYFLLLAWASLYFALLAGYQANAAQRREAAFRSAAKSAELRSLRYQVNPHFLFNTLNSLSALVMTGKPQRAEEMIQLISRFYRHSLAGDPTSDVALGDEFDLQRQYLEIEAVRFPERLRTLFDLPEELADARVPGMILQPLVENSVKYAVSNVTRPVTITVSAREEFDRLVLAISDDGPGVPSGGKAGFGIGLANVRDRLEARFGPDVVLTSNPFEGGYRTEMRIPLTRQSRRADSGEGTHEHYG